MNEKMKTAALRTKSFAKKTWKPVAVTAAATALYITLSTTEAKAQGYQQVSSKDSTQLITKNEVKVLGSKTFSVTYNKGTLYFENVYVDGKGVASFEVDVNEAKQAELENKTMADVKSIIYTKTDYGVNMAYLVFEYGILAVIPSANINTGGATYAFAGVLDEKIFPDAVFVAPNGGILATTPKTLIGLTPGKTISKSYKQMYGDDIPDLTGPTFTLGRERTIVDLRDPTFKDGNVWVKLEIDLLKPEVTVVEDKNPIREGK